MATREEAKQIRREQILAAARDMIRETSRTKFSMRALAERAGVSLVTPYNLFGSKQAIMYQLLDEDISRFGRQLVRSKKDPLDMLFRAVTLGRKYFDDEADYYRAVLFSVYSDGGTEYRSMFQGPRMALWRSLVEKAVKDGYLAKEVDANAFANNLASIYFANILEWVAGGISLRAMEIRTHYGFALALHSMAKPAHRARMREQVMSAQSRLTRLRG